MFIEKIILALQEHSIDYALVGGYAVALHGAVRGTVDVDIVIALNKESYQQTEKALNSIGLKSRLPVSAEEVFSFREEYIKNRNLIAWPFVNFDNPLEMVDIVITEDAQKLKHVIKQFNGLNINIISKEDLIKMKQASGRKQDLEDIKALEKIK